jgi:hypothetical protein
MPLIDRIGINIGSKHAVEDGLRWTAAYGLHYVECQLETGPEACAAFTAERWVALRTRAEAAGMKMGLHTPTPDGVQPGMPVEQRCHQSTSAQGAVSGIAPAHAMTRLPLRGHPGHSVIQRPAPAHRRQGNRGRGVKRTVRMAKRVFLRQYST